MCWLLDVSLLILEPFLFMEIGTKQIEVYLLHK